MAQGVRHRAFACLTPHTGQIAQEHFLYRGPQELPFKIKVFGPSSLRTQRARPGYLSITWRMADGSGQYHSLQTKFERRAGSAFFLVSYTWGHAISDSEQELSAVGVGNPGAFHLLFDRKLDKSSTTFDIRHRLLFSAVYEIPYRKNPEGVLGKVQGGWQTNFIFSAQTGNATQVADGTGRPGSRSR